MARQPAFFIPHGGGPCFFMDDPKGVWTGMEAFLRSLPGQLPEPPSAILVVSAHWETDGFAFTGAERPELVYDYYGFPPHTYEIRYDVPGAPELAHQAAGLLIEAGFEASVDARRGLDHGVFVPLKVAFPEGKIPMVEMSLDRRLAPTRHLDAGGALAPLRDKGVLIIGSGMSFHNMRGYGDPRFNQPSESFDSWLGKTVALEGDSRTARLADWAQAPAAQLAHPQEEHLIPLMVVAGTGAEPGRRIYREKVLETTISGFAFD